MYVLVMFFVFFFFKQKTAYEMRISDWSSDVCSSDLPPDISEVIAPNIEINRLVTAPLLGQQAKPLKINIKLTIDDLEGGPGTVVRFGSDTGLGGSIPTRFKAVLGGLEGFFNPLTAVVDPTGGYVVTNPNPPRPRLGPASS